MIIAIMLIVISPYTAFLPSVYTTFKMLNGNIPVYKNPWNIGLILLFVWSIIVGVLNKSVGSTLLGFVFLLYLSLSVYIQSMLYDEGKVEKVCRYLVKFSCYAAVLGIVEKILFTLFDMKYWRLLLGIQWDQAQHRVYSTFGNPNITGNWFAIMVLIAMYYGTMNIKNKDKKFYKRATILFVIELFLTGSRGAYVALLIGMVLLFLFKRNRNKYLKFFLGVFLLVVIIAVIPSQISFVSKEVPDKPVEVTDTMASHDIDRSVSTREAIWIGSVKMIKEKPITGWGFLGTLEYGKQYIDYSGNVYHSHNIWLAFLTSSGIIGLIIYLWMKLYIIKNLYILFKSKSKLFPLLCSIQVLILAHGVIDFTIIAPQTGTLFIATSAIIVALVQREKALKNCEDENLNMELDTVNK